MADAVSSGRVYLVDGTAQLFRAYFALGGLTNRDGLPTNAVYGFTAMLRKLIQEEDPPWLGVAFDPPGPVFRNEEFADYKANRPPMPEDLKVQFPYAKRVCEVLGIPVLELEGFEADDVIATFARKAREQGHEVVVVASDKDLLQLVGDGVSVLDPSKNRRLDAAGVAESFGVPPERVRDVQGLMGDSVDNIPGVPGVGRKTALAVVSTYGDLETVIARAERFAAAYEARDDWVEALDLAAKQTELTRQGAATVREAGARLGSVLERLIEVEQDGDLRARFEAAAGLLRAADLDGLASSVGQAGRRATRPLGAIKRELKGLDRGSSRKSWFSIRDHAEQARLSRRLATLREDVPLEFDAAALAATGGDRSAARALFSSLGFRRLTAEYTDESAAPEQALEATVGSAEVLSAVEGLDRLTADCRSAEFVAIAAIADETDPLRAPLVGVTLAPSGSRGSYIPLRHEYLGAPNQLAEGLVGERLAPILGDPSIVKVGHDVKRQLHLLRGLGGRSEGWTLDTMVASFLLDPGRSSYELSCATGEYAATAVASPDEFFGSGAKRRPVSEVEIGQVAAWATARSEALLELAPRLEAALDDAGLSELYRTIDGPLIPLLTRMEAYGILIDTPFLEAMSAEMERDLERTRAEIYSLAGTDFNLDSPKQMREVLFDKLGLKSRRKTAKGGAASTDAQTLEELADEHAIAGEILEYRGLAKLKSTYVDSLPRLVNPDTGRVHTHYDPTGAATGRLSSSDPNLQNIPVRTPAGKRIRQAFVPQTGYLFLASDYSQIELRVLAHLTGDAGLIAAFRAGEDIHRHTASQIFGVLPDLVSDEMRRRAKAINFGLLYGMSEHRLAREQGIKRTEARRFVEAYFERFASVRAYIDGVREQARRDAAVRTLFGRVRYFPQLRQRLNRGVQEQALRGAVNTTVQGTAADLMKLAMLRVAEALDSSGSGARMLLQVHDELLLEVPRGTEDEVREIVRREMEAVHPLEVPLVVDQKVGASWMEVT